MQIKQLSQSEPSLPPASLPKWMLRIDVMRSLRLHKMLAALITLLVTSLGVAFLARHRATYEATSVVYVSPNFPATLKVSEEQEYPYDSYMEEQLHSVAGFNVLTDAIRKLQPGVWQYPGESLESAADRLQHFLTVKRDGLSYQVRISLDGSNPTHLAEIVNAVTDSYLEHTKGEEFYGRDKRLDALRQERAQVQSNLTDKLREQTQISQALGVSEISSGEGPDQIDTQVAKLRADLTVAHEQRIQAEAQLSALENNGSGLPNSALDAAADEIIATDPSLLALKASLSQKRALLMDQLSGMTPNHPLRKTTEEQLSEIEAALQQMQANLRTHAAANLKQKLRTDLVRASTVEAKLLSDLQSNTKQATNAAPSIQRSQVLKGEITALQARYAALDERTRNLELESKSPGTVHLFSAARVPDGPLPSVTTLILPLLLPIAAMFAIATVVVVDYCDRRVHDAVDVEQILGFPPIGSLFHDQDVSMQIFDECTLRLAGGIDQAARTAGARTILLTSVNAGAGTTSIVENLGSTLAKLGRKTLTIDSSGATTPVAYLTYSLEQSTHRAAGSAQVKKQEVELRSTSAIAQPFLPKLTPLKNLMDQAFKDLTTDFDLVLIDATPILISAETEYLARFADVTILIAEASTTTKAQLTRAARLLERLQIPGMAVIINKIAYSRVNRATREDVNAFETRLVKGNVNWTSPWNRESTPAGHEASHETSHEKSERVEEKSTYA
jgi:succinoglycan biosynthesis transport protein ExoP